MVIICNVYLCLGNVCMLCMLQYSCLDEAVPRQHLYKSSLEIGEKFLRVTGSFARKLNASSAKVEWQKKQHLSDKATIEKLRSELAQLQQSLKPPASGKFS